MNWNKNRNRVGRFTLVELLMTLGIMSLIVYILMKVFIHGAFTSGEIWNRLEEQADARIAFEFLYRDVAGAYRFLKIDNTAGELELISAREEPTELSESLRGENPAFGKQPDPESLYLWVNKVRYYFKQRNPADKKNPGVVWREAIPGRWFLKKELFVPRETKFAKKRDVLAFRHVETFEFQPMAMDKTGVYNRIDPAGGKEKLAQVSSLHARIKMSKWEVEAGALEMAMCLHSRPMVSQVLYPGYFSTVDRQLDF